MASTGNGSGLRAKMFREGARRWLGAITCAGVLLALPAGLSAQARLSESDLYCAGFITQRPIERGLTIQGGEDGGFKNEFASGDYVYLSRGSDAINGTGGQYTIIRPMTDINAKEAFVGQRKMLQKLGTLYAEVGRLEVSVLHDQSATARILVACEPILAGDIAIPMNTRTAPRFKTPHQTARFVPPTGKAAGRIVAAKEYDHWLGEGRTVYLNLGSAQGIQSGNYLYITRGYLLGGNEEFGQASSEYLTEFNGVSIGKELSPSERAALPREVLGEVMVLSVEEGTSTGIITYGRSEIAVGDTVELE